MLYEVITQLDGLDPPGGREMGTVTKVRESALTVKGDGLSLQALEQFDFVGIFFLPEV